MLVCVEEMPHTNKKRHFGVKRRFVSNRENSNGKCNREKLIGLCTIF
jgi:hypothetical protein